MTLILNREDVISVLTMTDAIDAVEAAFAELARGTAELPLRNNIKPPAGWPSTCPHISKRWGPSRAKS